MNNQVLTRELYRRTMSQTYFSSDDIRAHRFDELLPGNPQGRLGAFIRWMQRQELITELGETRTTLPQGHGRRIRAWMWTNKARALYGK